MVLHITLESLLERDGRLQAWVDKSEDLSAASKLFARQARRIKSCCAIIKPPAAATAAPFAPTAGSRPSIKTA